MFACSSILSFLIYVDDIDFIDQVLSCSQQNIETYHKISSNVKIY